MNTDDNTWCSITHDNIYSLRISPQKLKFFESIFCNVYEAETCPKLLKCSNHALVSKIWNSAVYFHTSKIVADNIKVAPWCSCSGDNFVLKYKVSTSSRIIVAENKFARELRLQIARHSY